jgi:hypothetical protein
LEQSTAGTEYRCRWSKVPLPLEQSTVAAASAFRINAKAYHRPMLLTLQPCLCSCWLDCSGAHVTWLVGSLDRRLGKWTPDSMYSAELRDLLVLSIECSLEREKVTRHTWQLSTSPSPSTAVSKHAFTANSHPILASPVRVFPQMDCHVLDHFCDSCQTTTTESNNTSTCHADTELIQILFDQLPGSNLFLVQHLITRVRKCAMVTVDYGVPDNENKPRVASFTIKFDQPSLTVENFNRPGIEATINEAVRVARERNKIHEASLPCRTDLRKNQEVRNTARLVSAKSTSSLSQPMPSPVRTRS